MKNEIKWKISKALVKPRMLLDTAINSLRFLAPAKFLAVGAVAAIGAVWNPVALKIGWPQYDSYFLKLCCSVLSCAIFGTHALRGTQWVLTKIAEQLDKDHSRSDYSFRGIEHPGDIDIIVELISKFRDLPKSDLKNTILKWHGINPQCFAMLFYGENPIGLVCALPLRHEGLFWAYSISSRCVSKTATNHVLVQEFFVSHLHCNHQTQQLKKRALVSILAATVADLKLVKMSCDALSSVEAEEIAKLGFEKYDHLKHVLDARKLKNQGYSFIHEIHNAMSKMSAPKPKVNTQSQKNQKHF